MSTTVVLSAGLVCGLFAACAGETIPDVDDELITNVESVYAGNAVGAGAGGNGPVGSDDDDDDDDDDRANAGRGGSASASAAGAAGAGGDGDSGGAAGSASAGAAGAAGGGPVVGGGGASLAACEGFPIIQENCGTGSCHGAGSNLGTFAASEEEFIALIGEEGTICAGRGPLVDPADPEGSVLVQKLGDDPPCGQPMPAGSIRLDPEDIECLTSYIGGLE